jgi:D-amino-acid dehydrogenase
VVLCAGVQSAAWLTPLGLRVPLRPVYGYSVSAHMPDLEHGPRSGVMDERYKVAISRLGQRVRVAGSAQIGGQPDAISARAVQTLYKVLDDWFPAPRGARAACRCGRARAPCCPTARR